MNRSLLVDRTILLMPVVMLFSSPLIVLGVQSITDTHRANAAERRACAAAIELRYLEDPVLRKTRGLPWTNPCAELASLPKQTVLRSGQ